MSDAQTYETLKNELILNEQKNWVSNPSISQFNIEAVFCLMTPQSKALASQAVLDEVQGNIHMITAEMMGRHGVRFKNNKYENIQEFLTKYKEYYDIYSGDSESKMVRDIFAESIRGYGYKEASHLCRNAGRSNGIAIVDRHILNCYINRFELKHEGYELLAPAYQYCVGIFNKDLSLTKDRYWLIEDCIINYSRHLQIPEKYLDMIWWSEKSGHLFK